jgi:transcriptional antiterminator NusG
MVSDKITEQELDLPEALEEDAAPAADDVSAEGLELDETSDLDAEAAATAIAETAAPPEGERHWYVIHSYSGYENKVKKNLEHRAASMRDVGGDRVYQVIVPTEEEVELRDGKRRVIERRVFPGYILVDMIMDEDSWYVVRNTPGVTGFVGMGNKPTALTQEEVDKIMRRIEDTAPKIKISFRVGQKVRLVGGPFADFTGVVDEISPEKGKARVMVSFFGRETPVEVDFLQLEKV